MNNEKQIVVLGNNYDGCLLTGDCIDIKYFKEIKNQIFDDNNYKIIAGMKCCALYKDSCVFIWGRFNDSIVSHVITTFSFPFKISKISIGDSHILFLLVTGEVYVFGSGLHGELGMGNDILEIKNPYKLSSIDDIVFIKAGIRTSFLIDKQGNLIVFGSNRFNELGLNDKLEYIYTPIINYNLKKVLKVKAGLKHTIFKTEDSFYISGDNSKGVFGMDIPEENRIKNNIFKITKIDFEDISKIKAGWNNTYILSNKGDVYSTGFGKLGQLGLDESNIIFKFKKIRLSFVRKLIVGSDYTFAITKEDELFGWGWNEHYNLGLNHNKNIFSPVKVDYKLDKTIKIITGGAFIILYNIN